MSNMYFMWSSVSESNGVRLNRQPAQKSLELGMAQDVTSALEEVYRSDWGRIVAALIGRFGDFDAAEEAAQEAFAAAVDQWPASGVPEFPRAWIIQTARHKAIDRMRRQGRFQEKLESYVVSGLVRTSEEPNYDTEEIPDDRLRLIFTCCHPALAPEAQVALTLRTLCGLETDEIARAFLVPSATMAERLGAVLTVIYLVFNEGYAATRGEPLVRGDLCAEAIRLGRLVQTLMGPQAASEVKGLVALMLLHDSRRDARSDANGNLIILEEQDRSRWNRQQISEALPLVEEALRGGPGPLAVEAAIAALHCEAARAKDTDWPQIVRLYDVLERLQPSPIVSLNRAVAVAMVEGPQQALALIDELAATGELDGYHLLHATRADLLRRLGISAEAAASYRRALALVSNESERRFLERRVREMQGLDA